MSLMFVLDMSVSRLLRYKNLGTHITDETKTLVLIHVFFVVAFNIEAFSTLFTVKPKLPCVELLVLV